MENYRKVGLILSIVCLVFAIGGAVYYLRLRSSAQLQDGDLLVPVSNQGRPGNQAPSAPGVRTTDVAPYTPYEDLRQADPYDPSKPLPTAQQTLIPSVN